MKTQTAQKFFDLHADLLFASRIEDLLRAYSVPLHLYFEDGEIVLDSLRELHLIFSVHREQMRSNRVTSLTAEVVSIEAGPANRALVKVRWCWGFGKSAAAVCNDIDYIIDSALGAPRIFMTDFGFPIPSRFSFLKRGSMAKTAPEAFLEGNPAEAFFLRHRA